MAKIHVLSEDTVNKIAAGEVVERPAAVVKELVENAIDAGARAITIEIKEGGISFIRVTDNGSGIAKEDIPLAFLAHATSKISTVEDLLSATSLGFRGEALSSIAAVTNLEMLTREPGAMTGSRYLVDGGKEGKLENVGCPEGTTFLVRNLFFNTPARRKFLKTPMTEGGYIQEYVERMAISHPDIAIKFISNNQVKVQTSGNGKMKDAIYHIYGRDIALSVLEVQDEFQDMRLSGYAGKPVLSRGNRTYMNYFINGRYIKSPVIHKAIEEAYKPYVMQHRYPFTALMISMDSRFIDVNVHPTKMEVRFTNEKEVYSLVYNGLKKALEHKDYTVSGTPPVQPQSDTLSSTSEYTKDTTSEYRVSKTYKELQEEKTPYNKPLKGPEPFEKKRKETEPVVPARPKQLDMFESSLLTKKKEDTYQIVGQIFSTYWIVQQDDQMYIIDQHAAHEKVLYEKLTAEFKDKKVSQQLLNPPILLSLSTREEEVVKECEKEFSDLGFQIEHFGGKEYTVSAIPAHLPSIGRQELLMEMIDSLVDSPVAGKELLYDKIASMSCKAAVKGGMRMSVSEAQALIHQLMELDNPYHCPHGRPTIIRMSRQELEKKFKRIL